MSASFEGRNFVLARAVHLGTVLLALASPGTVAAQGTMSVVALGAEEAPGAAAPSRTPPGLTSPKAAHGLIKGSPPALAVLVDGRARVLVDPAPGTLLAAGARPLELGGLEAVLLTSTRPRSTAELPLLLGEAGGPGGTVRLVGPAAGGRWPSTSRWAAVLFGPSGLYAALREPPRSLRVTPTDVAVGAERRATLGTGVSLRAVTRSSPEGPLTAFRVERAGASVVLLGAAPSQPVPALVALAQGADLLVASLAPGEAGRGLASIASGARVRALWVPAADAEARQALENVAPTVVGSTRSEQPVTHATEPAPAKGECRVDADCGTGKVCIGCGGEQEVRSCMTGCRSKADCPSGQACVQVECIRCPCPAQCTGR